MTQENEPATPAQQSLMQRLGTVPVGNRGIQLSTIDDVFRFAKAVAMSHLCPPGFSETDCFLIIQNGLEVGMSPMAALASTYIVNNRATIFGDMPLALVRQSGLLEDYQQEYQGKPFDDDYRCIITSKRKGTSEPIVTEYSVSDARLAEVWGKTYEKNGRQVNSPWVTAPKRMLLFRARGFNLRDNFGDVLKGCAIAELDDGENLPGFENARQAKVVAPSFGGGSPEPRPELAAPAVGSGIMSQPVQAPAAAPEGPHKRGPGRPRKVDQPSLIPENPEPKPDAIPVTEPEKAKPADQRAELIAKVKANLDADRIPIQAFLKMMHENAFVDAELKDIELGHVNLEDVNPGGLATALDVWDTDVKPRLGGGK